MQVSHEFIDVLLLLALFLYSSFDPVFPGLSWTIERNELRRMLVQCFQKEALQADLFEQLREEYARLHHEYAQAQHVWDAERSQLLAEIAALKEKSN